MERREVLRGEIVDGEDPLAAADAALGQQVAGLLHQRLVGYDVDRREAVKHAGRRLPDPALLELAPSTGPPS